MNPHAYNDPQFPHPIVAPGMVQPAGIADIGRRVETRGLEANNFRPPRSWSGSGSRVLEVGAELMTPVFDIKPWLRNDSNSIPRLNSVPIDTAAFEDLFGLGVDLSIESTDIAGPPGQDNIVRTAPGADLEGVGAWTGAVIEVATFAHASDPRRVRRVTAWTPIVQADFTGELFNYRWEAAGTRYWRVGLRVTAIGATLPVMYHFHCS